MDQTKVQTLVDRIITMTGDLTLTLQVQLRQLLKS